MSNYIYVKKFKEHQDYKKFISTQLEFYDSVSNGAALGFFLFLEHDDIYTIGRFTKFEDNRNLPIFRSTRGGNVTYHGPGQLIFYPIINLKSLGLKLKDFVDALQDAVLTLLNSFDLIGEKNIYGPGVWVQNKKIASIAVSVRKGISMHGLSINLNCSLDKFNLIAPCGNPEIMVGNLEDLTKLDKHKCCDLLANNFFDEIKSRINYPKKNKISLSADSFESEP